MEFKSRIRPLGLPLLHIATGSMVDGQYRRGIAKGWIAIGDISLGVIFSSGGIAVGGVAIGGLTLGVLTLAGLGFGVYAAAGFAIGVWAFGGLAIGVHAALGGLAIASQYAIGGAAIAEHANDGPANDYFNGEWFFGVARHVGEYARWFILLAVVPVIYGLLNRLRGKQAHSQ